MSLPLRSFDLFFGTGGVGKTTLATARAIQLANEGQRVLLMTIDPAKRLKDILGLSDDKAGEVAIIEQLPDVGVLKTPLHALLMSPPRTIQRMGEQAGVKELSQNRIVEVLARPHGGMNEILALIELQMRLKDGQYDCVVLDTPPGPHFLDFLDGLEKIRKFFDQRFVEIFTSLGRRALETPSKGLMSGLFDKVVGAGVNKLLSYLQKVTGESFVEDFLGALEVIYRSRSSFMQGLAMEERLADPVKANWFLVTSVEQGKFHEALDIQKAAGKMHKREMFLVLNKTLSQELQDWHPVEGTAAHELRASLLNKETLLREKTRPHFAGLVDFHEILANSPTEHVKQLANIWSKHAN
jgi:anion-transporting  ArsA/GET3 family ATPase